MRVCCLLIFLKGILFAIGYDRNGSLDLLELGGGKKLGFRLNFVFWC